MTNSTTCCVEGISGMANLARLLGCVAIGMLMFGVFGCESSQKKASSAPTQYDHIPTAAEARAQSAPPQETTGDKIDRFFANLWPFKEKPPVKPIAATVYRFTVPDILAEEWTRESVQTLTIDFATDEGVFTDVDGIEYPQVFRESQVTPLENAVDNREWMQEMPRFREGADVSGKVFYELVVHQDDDQPDMNTIWADPDLTGMPDHPTHEISERLMAYVNRLVHPISNEVNLLKTDSSAMKTE